jgi:hypothetical protein
VQHTWSRSFERAYKVVSTPLDRRALRICEAWIIWCDAYNCRPDADLIGRFGTAEPASLAAIARMITQKLVTDCEVQMPMPLPAQIIELLESDTQVTETKPQTPMQNANVDPFDIERGPRPY